MTRRLAAILVADIAGYSRLMHEDEAATHARFSSVMRAIVEPAIAQHDGRLVKSMGDGLLCEFGSAVEAVGCALQFQDGMVAANAQGAGEPQLEFRAGIHVGEVIIEERDIYGDGVNIAARLAGVAEPGGTIVSEAVHENVRGRLPCGFEDLGAQQVKNIARPVRLFRIVQAAMPVGPAATLAGVTQPPSVAVLPFQNLSGDPAQDNVASGIVEDIATALSRFRTFEVIARSVRQAAARYAVEGSLRKTGNRLRISVQAVQVESGARLWAERYDFETTDIFGAQDETTAGIVTALVPALERAEIERARRKPASTLGAHDLYFGALAAQRAGGRKGNAEARRLIGRALALDRHLVAALVLADEITASAVANGWLMDEALAGLLDRARLAAELAPDDAEALATLALRTAASGAGAEQAVELAGRAVAANPHSAPVWSRSGYACLYAGQPDAALHQFECAEQLGGDDEATWSGIGYALLGLGRDAAALDAARRAAHHHPASTDACRILAAGCALLGQSENAAQALWRLLELDPTCSIQAVQRRFGADGGARLIEGLRRAGLAETRPRPPGGGRAAESAGGTGPEPRRVLLLVQPGAPDREITLGPAPLLIGRGADADIVLADKKVSRAHCRIVLADGAVTATDLDSTNGTFVDGERIGGTTPLEPGALVEIGSCRLEYRCEEPADPDRTIAGTPPEGFARLYGG